MADQSEIEISAGLRVAAFLDDPAVAGAIAALDLKFWKEMKASKSDVEAQKSIAAARALEGLGTALTAIVDTGKRATAVRDRNTRR